MVASVTSTAVTGNSATSIGTLLFGGGGVFVDELARATILNADLTKNTATVGDGGGVLNMGGTLTLTNTVVAQNTASKTGGGVYTAAWGKTTIEFSTIAGNTATVGAGVGLMTAGSIALGYPTTDLDSSVVYSNNPDAVGSFDAETPVTASYSDIESGTLTFAGSNNNVDGDPLFVNGGSLDFELGVGSAAVDAGNPATAPATDHDGTTRPNPPNAGAFE